MYHQGSQVSISYLKNECRRFFEVKNHYQLILETSSVIHVKARANCHRVFWQKS
jgi:hypothetical protein